MRRFATGKQLLGVLIVIAMILPGCSAQRPSPPSEESSAAQEKPAQADPEILQAVDGLGVNANVHSWNNGELKPAIDTIAQMGPLTWRVIVERADWEPVRHGTDPSVFDWDYYEKIYTAGKMADLFNTIAYINSKPGQKVSVNVMGGVPQWMGGTEIKPEFEDYWVRMIASMVFFARENRKLDFTLLSPLNETDLNGIEGPLVGPEQYVRLMHKLSDALDKLGLSDIRFVGPDTANADNAVQEYLPPMSKDRVVMDRTVHFGIHSYDGTSANAAKSLGNAASSPTNVWVTEFAGPCPGCDDGAPNPGNWDTAQDTAGLAISLLRSGVSGLQFYDAWDGYYEHHGSVGYWGLLAYDEASHSYSPRKNYYVLRQLFEFVRPGSHLIDCTSSVQDVQLVCLLEPGTSQLVVYGSNAGNRKATVQISAPAAGAAPDMSFSQTDATSNLVSNPKVGFANGSTSVVVAPRSVFTLASQPGR